MVYLYPGKRGNPAKCGDCKQKLRGVSVEMDAPPTFIVSHVIGTRGETQEANVNVEA